MQHLRQRACPDDTSREARVGGPLDAIAYLVRRQLTLVNLSVDAAVTGDRKKALQALALDPMVDDLDTERALLHDYLEANWEYLPQFR